MDMQVAMIQQAKQLIIAGIERIMSKALDFTFYLNTIGLDSEPIPIGRGCDIAPIMSLLYLKWHIHLLQMISCDAGDDTNRLFRNLWSSHTVMVEVIRALDDFMQSISRLSSVSLRSTREGDDPTRVSPTLTLGLSQRIKIMAVLREVKVNFMIYHGTISFSDLSAQLQTGWYPNTVSLGQSVDEAIGELSGTDLRVYRSIWRDAVSLIDETIGYTVESELSIHRVDGPFAWRLRQLYHAAIPILKLARVLLNKMSKATNTDHHPIERMSHDMQLALISSTHLLASHLDKFVHTIDADDPYPPRVTLDPLDCIASAVTVALETISDFLDHDFPPYGDRLSNESCKRWYESWTNLFKLATRTYRRTLNG
ncbi:hypothetical protein PSTG_13299 [Puccinia striiformis f. sp. tritici PST-78]|uniref:Uncharacterized protein n=1 Tax=Puccinia striiformis f. sp. tritici PST-78 TaxID=1165861 RepID=A0A0L0V231_9BASI|nr:hypothetical protein PSTG_13299 [Puccinia striiformis f. sp. tritici PST-78]